jgi:hypothetical protein
VDQRTPGPAKHHQSPPTRRDRKVPACPCGSHCFNNASLGGGARAQPERTGLLGSRLSCAIPLRSCPRRTAPRREGKGCFRATESACVDEPAQPLNRLAAPCRPDNSILLCSASHNLPRLGSAVRISSPAPNFLKKIKEAMRPLGPAVAYTGLVPQIVSSL